MSWSSSGRLIKEETTVKKGKHVNRSERIESNTLPLRGQTPYPGRGVTVWSIYHWQGSMQLQDARGVTIFIYKIDNS
jgi:hypothetical protein